jgi:hypothetical protein
MEHLAAVNDAMAYSGDLRLFLNNPLLRLNQQIHNTPQTLMVVKDFARYLFFYRINVRCHLMVDEPTGFFADFFSHPSSDYVVMVHIE